MPYLTPDEIPEDDACRPLFIPDSTAWLAIVSGALTELTQPYNWEEFGTLTVEQCVERMQEMIDAYYDEPCGECTLPGGGKIIRINLQGHFEEACGASWCEPTGDYAIPSIPARTEPTSDERRCLAAANAENVLAQLYEGVVDDFNEAISAAESLLALGTAIGIALAPPLGLAAASALAIVGIAFGEFFAFMDFLTEDVWDDEFSEKLRCILLDCATDTAGVVTFDYDCLVAQLGEYPEAFDFSFSQIRLIGQVLFLLNTISIDGLNLAGTTTVITEYDCGVCLPNCAGFYDFEIDEQGWIVQPARGTYVTAQYFQDTATGLGYDALTIRLYCNPMHIGVNGFKWVFSTSGAAGVNVQSFRQSDDSLIRTLYTSGSVNTGGAFTTYIASTSGYDETVPFFFQINITMATGGVMRIRSVEIIE